MDRRQSASRLVLGGHSFIEQLGNDPVASDEAQRDIVRACLDSGVCWFDTTYQPERIALGRALAQLGRRDEATIIAWNFFVDFSADDEVGGPAAYQPHHIEQMLRQLQTDRIDCLVVHETGDEKEDRRQEQLAVSWQQQGMVGRLGVWYPGADAEERFGRENPYSFMVRPFNVATQDAGEAFAACKALGWETLACSPYVRGWRLDELAKKARDVHGGEETALRARLADLMLRFSLHAPNVDRLIVAMRKAEWVANNVMSACGGPLNAAEQNWLETLL